MWLNCLLNKQILNRVRKSGLSSKTAKRAVNFKDAYGAGAETGSVKG